MKPSKISQALINEKNSSIFTNSVDAADGAAAAADNKSLISYSKPWYWICFTIPIFTHFLRVVGITHVPCISSRGEVNSPKLNPFTIIKTTNSLMYINVSFRCQMGYGKSFFKGVWILQFQRRDIDGV